MVRPFRVVETPAFMCIEAADGARLCSMHTKTAAGSRIDERLVRERAERLCEILNRSARSVKL